MRLILKNDDFEMREFGSSSLVLDREEILAIGGTIPDEDENLHEHDTEASFAKYRSVKCEFKISSGDTSSVVDPDESDSIGHEKDQVIDAQLDSYN